MTPRPDLFAVVSRHRWPLCPSALLRAHLLCAGSPLGQRIRTQLADDLEIAVFNHLIARDAATLGFVVDGAIIDLVGSRTPRGLL